MQQTRTIRSLLRSLREAGCDHTVGNGADCVTFWNPRIDAKAINPPGKFWDGYEGRAACFRCGGLSSTRCSLLSPRTRRHHELDRLSVQITASLAWGLHPWSMYAIQEIHLQRCWYRTKVYSPFRVVRGVPYSTHCAYDSSRPIHLGKLLGGPFSLVLI